MLVFTLSIVICVQCIVRRYRVWHGRQFCSQTQMLQNLLSFEVESIIIIICIVIDLYSAPTVVQNSSQKIFVGKHMLERDIQVRYLLDTLVSSQKALRLKGLVAINFNQRKIKEVCIKLRLKSHLIIVNIIIIKIVQIVQQKLKK